MNEPAISFSDLGYAYDDDKWILRNYAGSLSKGAVLAVLGPNGRGKTTLLKLILGILAPREGALKVSGTFAFVPQLFQVSFDFSCLEMVLMGRAKKIDLFARPSKADEEAALAALERVGIAEHAFRPFHELSGGQRQLVIFARALVSEANILVLDEPTSALDLKNQAQVLSWINTLAREDGLTVLMTTHHPHHALAVADKALLMLGVDRFTFGPAAEVLDEAALSGLYETPMKRIVFEHDGRRFETLAPLLSGLSQADSQA